MKRLLAFLIFAAAGFAQTTCVGCNGSGGAPSGAAGGDLSGSYPNPSISKLNGNAIPVNASGNLNNNGSGVLSWTAGATGTVTNFTVTSVPSWLTPSVATGTSTPALTLSLTAAQTSHQVIGTCGAGTTFIPCSLVAADIPTLNQNTTGTAVSFTGSLVGDVTGTQGATVVGKVNGVSFAGLATGIVKNTTTTGVPSIASAGDFPTLNQSTTGNALTATSATSFTGSLVGDVTGTQGATVVGKINGTTMSALGTGIVKNTTTTGVPSIAVANDFPTLNQSTTGTSGALATGGIACTDSNGSGTTYTCTPSPALTAYTTGTFYLFTPGTISSGAATLNVSALGAKAILQNKNQVVHANDLIAGHEYLAVYDGTSFQLLGTGDTQGFAIARCVDDGSTDATTCLQTYLTNYLAVFIPKATTYYKVTAPLILQSNQHIIGAYKPSSGINGGIGCASTTAHCLWAANSNQGYYVSGATVTGSATQTCAVSFTGGGTATLALTGTNAVATGTAFTAVSGISGVPGPVAATLANGTATCSGTIVVWTITGQGSRNVRIENLYVSDQVRGTRTLGHGIELDGTGGAAAFTLEEDSIYGFENGVDFLGGCCTSTLKQVRSDSALNDAFHEHGQASTGITYESTYGDAPGNYCYYASIQNYSGYLHTSCDASGSDAYHIATADGGTSRGLTFDGAGTESPLGTGFFIDATNVGLNHVDATTILNGFFPINLSHAGAVTINGGYLTTAGTYGINVAAAPAYGATAGGNTITTMPYISGATIANINDTFKSIIVLNDGIGTVLDTVRFVDATPTIAAGTGAGTSPTVVTVTGGHSNAGLINITVGSGSPATAATLATVSFANTLNAAPSACLISPANAATAALAVAAQPFVSSTSTTTFVVTTGGTALATSGAYKWWYHCF